MPSSADNVAGARLVSVAHLDEADRLPAAGGRRSATSRRSGGHPAREAANAVVDGTDVDVLGLHRLDLAELLVELRGGEQVGGKAAAEVLGAGLLGGGEEDQVGGLGGSLLGRDVQLDGEDLGGRVRVVAEQAARRGPAPRPTCSTAPGYSSAKSLVTTARS